MSGMNETIARSESVAKRHATEAMAKLDDMRLLARDAAAESALAELPPELHWEVIGLVAVIESLEARVGEHATQADAA